MRHARIIPASLAVALLAAACHPHGPTAYPTVTLDGVAMSSAATATAAGHGSPPTGAAAGTAISAFLHPETLRQIAPSDRPHLERAVIRAHAAMPGERVEWANTETGNHGAVTPSGARRTSEGLLCNEMKQDVNANGTEHYTYTSACRQEDGTWARRGQP